MSERASARLPQGVAHTHSRRLPPSPRRTCSPANVPSPTDYISCGEWYQGSNADGSLDHYFPITLPAGITRVSVDTCLTQLDTKVQMFQPLYGCPENPTFLVAQGTFNNDNATSSCSSALTSRFEATLPTASVAGDSFVYASARAAAAALARDRRAAPSR